jgi:hypothetical protein
MPVVDSILVAFGFQVDTKELAKLKQVSDDAAKSAEQNAEKTRQAWSKLGQGLNTLAIGVGSAIAGIGVLISKAAEAGAAIDDVSKQTGVSAREFQRLSFAVQMGGGTVEDTKNSFKFLSKALVDARDSASPAAEAFRKLGLNAGRLNDKSLSTEERFAMLADAFSKVEDSSLRTDLALTLFGRGGLALVPALSEGSAAIKKLGDEAESLGLVKGQAAIDKMAELDDKILKIKLQFAAAAESLAHQLVPVLESVAKNWDEWKVVLGGVAVAWAALKVPGMIAEIGTLATSIKALAGSWGGAIAGALAFGVAIGKALDEWLKLSDAIAGVEGTTGTRGAGPMIGELNRLDPSEQVRMTDINRALAGGATGEQRLALIAERNALTQKASADRVAQREAQKEAKAAAESQVKDTVALQGLMLGGQLVATNAVEEDRKKRKKRGGGKSAADREKEKALAGLRGSYLFQEIEIMASRVQATPDQLEEAYKAAAESKVGHARDSVAKKAAASKLSSLVGFDVGAKYQDPLLSEMFGEATLPPVPLSELERGQQPQVLISTINNTYTVDAPISINGAGEPSAVGTVLQEAIRSLFRDEVDKVSRFSKTVFQR